MTKAQLVDALSRKQDDLRTPDVRLAVNAVLGALSDALAAGNRIELRGFGSFEVNRREARVSRNPRTGESITVPRKYVPHFKMGKDLKTRVNTGE